MTSRTHFALALVFGLSLAACLSALAQTSKPANAADPLQATAVKDPKTGLSLRIPKDWVPKKDLDNTSYEAPARDEDKSGNLAPNLIITSSTIEALTPADLPVIINAMRKELTKTRDGFQEVKYETTKINGKTAGILTYTAMEKKTIKIEQQQAWILTDGKSYTVTFSTLASTVDKNQALFDAILKTVTVP